MTDLNSEAGLTESAEEAVNYTSRSRMFWTFADQAISSLTNVGLSLLIARSVSEDDFGAFALAFVTFTFAVGLVRCIVGEPYVVKFSAVNDAERRRGTAHGTGAALSLGLLAAVPCLIVVPVLGGQTGAAFAALAISMPGLMLADTWRHMFFAAGRPAAAAVNDAVWAVLQFTLLAILLTGENRSMFLITMAWGMSALVAALVGYLQTGIAPAPRATFSWLRETRDMSVQLGLGFTLNMGAINVVTYAIGGLLGLAAAAAMRSAQVLLGPLNLVFAGFNAFVLPVLSRAAVAGDRLLRPALFGGLALSGVAAVWVAILVLIPDSLGEMILKKNWEGADRLMLPCGLLLVTVALVLGATNSLVALSRTDLMLRLTSIQAPFMLVLGVGGAWQWGVVEAAYGLFIAQAVGVVLGWIFFLKADADPRRWAEQPEV